MKELFTVEHDDGEMLDSSGDGGFSVYTNRAEAQDAIDSMSEDLPMTIVCYVRECPGALDCLGCPACNERKQP